MVKFVILGFIKYSMLFKKRFAKKDNIDHILIGNFFVDLQYFPNADLWRLCIKNLKESKWFIYTKQGTKQFSAGYGDFVKKVILGDKSLLGFR